MIIKYLIKLTFITILFSNFTLAIEQPPANFQLSNEELEALKNNPFGPLSDQEINEFVKFINELSPEELAELEKLGESIIKEMETSEQKEEPISETKIEEAVKPEPTKIQRPAFEEKNKVEAQKIIRSIIKYLREIRQEAIKDEAVSRRLKIWDKDLNDLTYFLHVLDKNELLEHLASKDFSKLYNDLKKFKENLEDNIGSFKVQEVITEEEFENPYEILGVNEDATTKEIEAAFKKLKAERDPKILENRLKNAGLSDKEISKQIKETKLSFGLIETAYESLKNSKIRTQIDNELKTKQSPYAQIKQISKSAFNKILASFSTIFYDNAVLNQIQKLLEKYEPQALEKKKEIDKAQEMAKKAQEELSKKTVTSTKSSSYREPSYGYKSPSGYDSGYPAYSAPYGEYGDRSKPGYDFGPERTKIGKDGGDNGGGKGKGKVDKSGDKTGDKDKDKDSGKDGGKAAPIGKDKGKEKEKEEKEKKDPVIELLKEFDESLKNLSERA